MIIIRVTITKINHFSKRINIECILNVIIIIYIKYTMQYIYMFWETNNINNHYLLINYKKTIIY